MFATPQAYAWYGQTIQTKAKAVDGGMEQVPDERYLRAHGAADASLHTMSRLAQAKVVATSVSNWEQAASLDPHDPLPLHLLGSFVFVTCGLPWIATKALRGLSPGLKKYSYDDALSYLLESERLQPSPPWQYSVTNQSMIGRIYAMRGTQKPSERPALSNVDASVLKSVSPPQVTSRQPSSGCQGRSVTRFLANVWIQLQKLHVRTRGKHYLRFSLRLVCFRICSFSYPHAVVKRACASDAFLWEAVILIYSDWQTSN